MSLLLVDSSVWIQSFSKKPNVKHLDIIKAVIEAEVIATCDVVILEVLRGARSEAEYKDLMDKFSAMRVFSVHGEHWELASKMGHQLSRKGFNPPSTDLIIAAVAIIEKCELLHQDKDFKTMAKYFPLKCVE
jgi:predicted nucleic acid-binding protein